mmetsp:Transcript_15687/g.24073  ORF Transcript_15687/g.24073 Transcript_15687/m.24073 type:complete len:81 (+) Transcript_15687:156-398(+)|eukprot:CAMPEP_0170481870 /NCGR_PEP_ID=MMETSP0208-20121228/2142_1 /TAXON_ID=197538 /ORGANISM="Strombidium inclinatum, Strain S3" /LENGTH=80 /DNA_ID=CAMNT_0010754649 /DNA_START=139 /DNA_END=381 /DNA_ORIENTATION=+
MYDAFDVVTFGHFEKKHNKTNQTNPANDTKKEEPKKDESAKKEEAKKTEAQRSEPKKQEALSTASSQQGNDDMARKIAEE